MRESTNDTRRAPTKNFYYRSYQRIPEISTAGCPPILGIEDFMMFDVAKETGNKVIVARYRNVLAKYKLDDWKYADDGIPEVVKPHLEACIDEVNKLKFIRTNHPKTMRYVCPVFVLFVTMFSVLYAALLDLNKKPPITNQEDLNQYEAGKSFFIVIWVLSTILLYICIVPRVTFALRSYKSIRRHSINSVLFKYSQPNLKITQYYKDTIISFEFINPENVETELKFNTALTNDVHSRNMRFKEDQNIRGKPKTPPPRSLISTVDGKRPLEINKNRKGTTDDQFDP